jgi:hypothetical protein
VTTNRLDLEWRVRAKDPAPSMGALVRRETLSGKKRLSALQR